MKIAILASGNGTNFEVLTKKFQAGEIPGTEALMFCNHPNAPVIKRAQRLGIPYETFSVKECGSKQAYESRLLKVLKEYKIDFIILSGYLRVVGSTILNEYPDSIVNLHPALLPKYPGLNSIARAFEDYQRGLIDKTGVTVHFIDARLDHGPIIAQKAVPIYPDDTEETLETRVHETEHELFPMAVSEVIQKRMKRGNKVKRALVSVSDKTNLVPFVKGLVENHYEIISTGGTKKKLDEAGIKTISVEEITGFPEILDGRVKTLNPYIHGGLLAERDKPEHMKTLEKLNIHTIDLVCVNLYPFKQTIEKPNVELADAIENIDIGGPSLLRAASKNYASVTVVTDQADYDRVLKEITENGDTNLKTRAELAAKVFRTTAAYDALIAEYLTKQTGLEDPEKLTLTYDLKQRMRYGENSHQKAWLYEDALPKKFSILQAEQLHGKKLSYNNIKDADEALRAIREFQAEPTVVAMKHMNPCGIGRGKTLEEAWDRAYEADSISIFGGVIALNRKVDLATAKKMHKIFLEIVIAPGFDDDALAVLEKKKNIRLLQLDFSHENEPVRYETVSVMGGLLMQEQDVLNENVADWKCVTDVKPTEQQLKTMMFALKAVKHTKSNAIVVANNERTLGVGAGQPNRIDSAKIAVKHAGEAIDNTAVMSSDAFFPFGDCVEYAGKHGIKAIVQPGGSVRDQESIEAANKYGIAMVFTGYRHFRH
ncbi:phosphoribosylaminoimidazolecarboxamide formyltransferase [Lactobacillus helveticus DPC 4571]|uniref:Bifunctional purine biosynthesis protein PurH n=3 Tax=Lactobacillus helveticus TaxID=1587 RepID=A0A2X0QYN7_LACHE|nr:phosphoribosylglycinamidine formyltransferase AICAR transformylase/IMP cyclohydrolase [Lactobacillus helveticus CNRZ32]ABX27468.1 phosphoribosylaminoimidazolecarboxamide formyltransferase [Lactobacillus helveticus DPC 4571]MBW7979890.1 bifunctional phosphoribosylaminoimidazolecarboxamide formyltransferase/IMP cyclohydrolase [Lactobacillus helveticus]CDI62626.1 Phosphoribosylglycinamidine formyltransferase AICAR transformylase/IMP cyclohydrolase [Lactobacillus helveticus CIRM-BIA 103]AGQ23879